MPVEPAQRRVGLLAVAAREEEGRGGLGQELAQIGERSIGIAGELREELREALFREARGARRLGHRRHLRGQERRAWRVPQQPSHEVHVERARDRLAEEQRVNRQRPSRFGGQSARGEVMPGGVRDHVRLGVLVDEHVAPGVGLPEREVQEKGAVRPSGRSLRQNAKRIGRPTKHFFQVGVERDVAERGLVADREVIDGSSHESR